MSRPLLAGTLAVAWALAAWASSVGTVVAESASGTAEAAAAQRRIDALADDADTMAAEYRAAIELTRALAAYRERLAALLASQGEELASLERQIDGVGVVARQVLPLMERMLAALDAFVGLDLPALPDERRRRLASLRSLMDRADVTIAEKYRRLLEAYQVELEYGRTIEAYRGRLPDGRTVDFVRIGRIGLFYQTLDAREAGRWSPDTAGWELLDGHRAAVRDAIRIARKQAPPDLLTVPVPAPEAAP